MNNVNPVDVLAPNLGWTNAVHGRQGNVVLMDGSVSTTSSEELREAFKRSEDENGTAVHLIRAR